MASISLLAALDTVWVLATVEVRPAELPALFAQGIVVALAAGLAIGAVQGVFTQLLARVGRRASRRAAVLVVSVGLMVPGSMLLADRWPGLGWPARSGMLAAIALTPVVAGALARALVFIWNGARRRASDRGGVWRAAPGALLAMALLAVILTDGADRVVLPRLYPRAHDALFFSAFVLAELFVLGASSVFPLPRVVRRVVAGIVLATAAAGTWSLSRFRHSEPLQVIVFDRTALQSRALGAARALFDRDGDGYSAILGGGDCDDGRSAIHPGAIDIPENGRDEDCSGADLTLEQLVPSRGAPVPLRPARPLDVLLITIDTLRADHVGIYGYGRDTTPALDELAAESLLFERAYAQGNATASSLPSLLTGRYPSSSPWQYDNPEGLGPGWPYLTDSANVTLPEVLGRVGYATEGLAEGHIVFGLGLAQGFDSAREGLVDLPGELFRFLDRTGRRRWFCWMHFAEPHAPYRPQPLYHFGDRDIDRYDGEIAAADAQVREVLERLRRDRRLDSTIVIVTADHGEEFRDHGGVMHASTLYDEQIRVPLIVRIPGVEPARIQQPAELVDVMPTILTALGLEAPKGLDGEPLTGLVVPGPQGSTLAYSEYYENGRVLAAALFDGRYKLIEDRRSNMQQLFDLFEDPRERDNLAAALPTVRARLSTSLRAMAARRELLLLAAARRTPGARDQLARSLELFRNSRLLNEALSLLEEDAKLFRSKALTRSLERAARRPDLPKANRAAMRRMLGRQGTRASRRALRRLRRD